MSGEKKPIVVSKEVHKHIMQQVLDCDDYSSADDFLRDALGVNDEYHGN
jgi:Arc/MetJ-type ribon-helix-helix transcriptional regulator